ncbi:MAG: hypothetical protein QOJ57_6 [Thermoleophilaceae bacterium]|nr:hypothetical protein [Thermoleophilaceae bacterium]
MRTFAITALVLAALLCGSLTAAAPRADAAKSLSSSTALRYAKRAATNRANRTPGMDTWEIARGFRFESRKWVFVWAAQMTDGRVCSAQLVTRYASSLSSKVIAYFRMEECS